jgi:hypothetical protein
VTLFVLFVLCLICGFVLFAVVAALFYYCALILGIILLVYCIRMQLRLRKERSTDG